MHPLRLTAVTGALMGSMAGMPDAFASDPSTVPPSASVRVPSNQPQPATVQACIGIQIDATRLACYDQVFGRQNTVAAPDASAVNGAVARSTTQSKTQAALSSPLFAHEAADAYVDTTVSPSTSLLDQRWELSPASKLGTFTLRAYRPVYVLPVFYTDHLNTLPGTPNPENRLAAPQKLDDTEAKFQLSLKAKVMQGVFGDQGDLWFGYTQDSHWQVYNAANSRPFRETNYEPDASLIFGTNYQLLGMNGRLVGLTLDHQSNGRALPLSRSWNRVMLDLGFERDNWVVMLRPWYRIPENKADDDNPDITDYIGRGDVTITRKWYGHEFTLMLRHSLKSGDKSHGAAQFDWSFPLDGNLRGFLQLFDGYGESLIDYNHRAGYAGLGVSLLNWY